MAGLGLPFEKWVTVQGASLPQVDEDSVSFPLIADNPLFLPRSVIPDKPTLGWIEPTFSMGYSLENNEIIFSIVVDQQAFEPPESVTPSPAAIHFYDEMYRFFYTGRPTPILFGDHFLASTGQANRTLIVAPYMGQGGMFDDQIPTEPYIVTGARRFRQNVDVGVDSIRGVTGRIGFHKSVSHSMLSIALQVTPDLPTSFISSDHIGFIGGALPLNIRRLTKWGRLDLNGYRQPDNPFPASLLNATFDAQLVSREYADTSRFGSLNAEDVRAETVEIEARRMTTKKLTQPLIFEYNGVTYQNISYNQVDHDSFLLSAEVRV